MIATARPAEEPVDIPADAPRPPAYEDVAAAAVIFDVDAYRHRHEYPTCFTCGPDRAVGDGLRIFPAPTDRADRRAWPWTPDASVLTDAGTIEVPVMWAALDCPSGRAWLEQDPSLEAIVLGKMAAVIHRLPNAGEHLVVCGWPEAAEGRRRPARSAVFDASGAVVAASRATWVVLTANSVGRSGRAVDLPRHPGKRQRVRRIDSEFQAKMASAGSASHVKPWMFWSPRVKPGHSRSLRRDRTDTPTWSGRPVTG